jgi:ferredoxin
MSSKNFHSIHITKEKCIGCVQCLRVCPYDAVHSHTTSFAALDAFDYKVAIPSTVLYGQFGGGVLPTEILSALRRIGFDEVYDLSSICELNCAATEEYLAEHPRPRPFITSTCPVVVRIIQRRYPSLCGQILPIEPPREIAAKILRTILPKALGIPPERIGIIHLTPCSAKMVSINSPATLNKSYLDGAISIRDIFPQILNALRKSEEDALMGHLFPETQFSGIGMGWSLSGGETRGFKHHKAVAVSGVVDTMRVLDQVESGLLQDIDVLECTVCPDGCVGGPLEVENRFLAKSRILQLVAAAGERAVVDPKDVSRLYHRNFLSFDHPAPPVESHPLDRDPAKAIHKAARRDRIFAMLPKKDCGVCGAPDCRTLADDIVRGRARLGDCPFVKPAKTRKKEKR